MNEEQDALIEQSILTQYSTTELEVDIDQVVPNKWNPNRMSKQAFEKLVAYIKLRGYARFIAVRDYAGYYQILDGEHRWRACKELGFKTIKVHNFGEIPEHVAKEITLNFNNIHGEDDIFERAKILKEMREKEASGQPMLFPMETKAVDEEIALLDFDFDKYKNTKLTPKDEDEFAKIVAQAIRLSSILKGSQNIKDNHEAWLLVLQGLDWCKAIIDIYKNNKEIKVVPGQTTLPLEHEELLEEIENKESNPPIEEPLQI
jgi:hypothetical protein